MKTSMKIMAVAIICISATFVSIALINNAMNQVQQEQQQLLYSPARVITVDARNWKAWAYVRGNLGNGVLRVPVTPGSPWIRYTWESITFFEVANVTGMQALVQSPLYCRNWSSVIFRGVNASNGNCEDFRFACVAAIFCTNGTWWMRTFSFSSGYSAYDEAIFEDLLPRMLALAAIEQTIEE